MIRTLDDYEKLYEKNGGKKEKVSFCIYVAMQWLYEQLPSSLRQEASNLQELKCREAIIEQVLTKDLEETDPRVKAVVSAGFECISELLSKETLVAELDSRIKETESKLEMLEELKKEQSKTDKVTFDF